MKRKVINISGNTMMVSLPAKWVAKKNIKKGDELGIEEKENCLIVSTDSSLAIMPSISCNLKGLKEYGTRYLAALYQNGYDEILVETDDIDGIRKMVLEQFVGLEIVSYTKDSCRIKSISSGSMEDFDNFLRRTLLINKQMLQAVFQALSGKNISELKSVEDMEITNNRFTQYCRRLLIKNSRDADSRLPFKFSFVSELEKMADLVKYLTNHIQRAGVKELDADLLDSFRLLIDLSEAVMNLYFKYDFQKMPAEYIKCRNQIQKERRQSGASAILSTYVISVLQSMSTLLGYITYINADSKPG